MAKARFLGGCAVAAIVAASGPALARTPQNTMVMAWNIDAISTFDPAQIGEVVTNELITNICDSLVMADPENEAGILPAVAESWTVSEDGMVITFNMRRDAVHPSGNPVTAHDLVWSMTRVVELAFGNAAMLTSYGFTKENAVESFVALDDHTFQMTLSDPYPLDIIMQAVVSGRVGHVLDSEYLKTKEVDNDRANGYLTTNTACVGPYRLRQWSAGEVVILEANENYYGEAPKTPRWIIRHVPEAGSQRLLIEQGDVDVARDLGSEDLRALSQNPDVQLMSTLNHQIFYMSFHNEKPPFDDDRVRLAFRYLINYDQLAETVMAFAGVPRNTVVPLGAFAALDEEEGAPFSLDIEKARALLAEAGYADGFTARMFIGTPPYAAPVAQHIQANAAQVGITLNIEQMANAQLFSAFRGREFDTLLSSWQTNIPHAHGMLERHAVNPDNRFEAALGMYPTWRSSWYRPDFNDRVREALFETDREKQIELYRALQQDHMQYGPGAYMFQMSNNAVVRSNVQDWTWHAFRVYMNRAYKD
ncbi:ABC transporter substrate-binding protein [Rubrimonas sp.]|uniref:ABC transporter substrate-binding protein n=1 Tax=Rubrimonas sp. TaxID=2036015 RepID=UPI002FDE6C0F